MSELILVMIIFFVLKMLMESAKKRLPPQEMPEYRFPGDDLPLPGPWNRRTENGAETETSMSGPWDIPGEPRADAPLPGPWDEKSSRPEPLETKTEPRREPGYKPETAAEPGPVREKRPEPRPKDRPRDRSEQVMFPEPRQVMVPGNPVPGRESVLHPGERETVETQGREAAAVLGHLRKRRKRQANPLTAVLSSQPALVGSIVLGQVLGTRGGRAAARRNPTSGI